MDWPAIAVSIFCPLYFCDLEGLLNFLKSIFPSLLKGKSGKTFCNIQSNFFKVYFKGFYVISSDSAVSIIAVYFIKQDNK